MLNQLCGRGTRTAIYTNGHQSEVVPPKSGEVNKESREQPSDGK